MEQAYCLCSKTVLDKKIIPNMGTETSSYELYARRTEVQM